jgi:hypothetical protein
VCFIILLSYFLLRMSLAMYAAPFNNEGSSDANNESNNHIIKKKMALNKTQKRYGSVNNRENVNTEKVMSILNKIHNLPEPTNELADFSPMPPPESMGVQSTIEKENTEKPLIQPFTSSMATEMTNEVNSNGTYDVYSENQNQNMSEDYYKRFIPNYDQLYKSAPHNVPNYRFSNSTSLSKNNEYSNTNEVLMEKLNYMINLLEDQQDERTNNVTEEVVLYSFLGIFIIFIVDAFSRTGKYTR